MFLFICVYFGTIGTAVEQWAETSWCAQAPSFVAIWFADLMLLGGLGQGWKSKWHFLRILAIQWKRDLYQAIFTGILHQKSDPRDRRFGSIECGEVDRFLGFFRGQMFLLFKCRKDRLSGLILASSEPPSNSERGRLGVHGLLHLWSLRFCIFLDTD